MKVDTFRYMLMFKYGGLYTDLDIENFKSFNNIIEKHQNSDIILLCDNKDNGDLLACNNGMMISKPNINFWKDVLNESLTSENAKKGNVLANIVLASAAANLSSAR